PITTWRLKRVTRRGLARRTRLSGSTFGAPPAPMVVSLMLSSARVMCVVRVRRAQVARALDANDLLMVLSQAQFGGGEELVDDVVVAAHAIVHEIAAAV